MDITLLIGTCDAYLDLIPNYLTLLGRYSKIQNPIIIGETQNLDINFITTPGKKEWGERILEGLEGVNTKYILFTLDDYYFQTPIDEYVDASIQIMESNNIDKVSFISNKHFRNYNLIPTSIDNFYMMDSSCRWLATLQMGIWKTEVFKEVLKPTYSPWDFEINGRNALTNKKCAVFDPQCELTFNFVRNGKQPSPGWEQFLEKEQLTYII